jgi:chaperone modulatory protein CbpM
MFDYELARSLQIDVDRLKAFIDRGWMKPERIGGKHIFRDVDAARAALICDLAAMGVNDEGVDVTLDLLDQLYAVRAVVRNLIEALEVQPNPVRRQFITDSRRLMAIARQRSHFPEQPDA